MSKNQRPRVEIRYSQAFKMAIVREIEQDGLSRFEVSSKYGIKGSSTVTQWLGKYGSGKLGRMIRVERPDEKNELHTLRERMKRLESLLADATLDLAIEKAYLKLACDRAGIQDVEEFKKKQALLRV